MPSRRYPNIAHLLAVTREAALRPFRPILAAHGLTGQQWRVIRVLREASGSLAASEIAHACGILAPSLSQILTGMEKNGLVRRERSSSDLRKQEVTLTPAAERIADAISPLVERQYALIEQAVGRQLLADAVAAVERLRVALEAGIPSAMDEPPPVASAARRKRRA